MNPSQIIKNISYKHIVFYLCLVIASSIYLCQRIGIALKPWINNYVNDFLTLPLVLSISLFIVRKIKKDPTLTLSIYLILLMASFYSVYFEYYLPQVTTRYTQDPIDIGLYFLGAICYYFFNRK